MENLIAQKLHDSDVLFARVNGRTLCRHMNKEYISKSLLIKSQLNMYHMFAYLHASEYYVEGAFLYILGLIHCVCKNYRNYHVTVDYFFMRFKRLLEFHRFVTHQLTYRNCAVQSKYK